MIFKQTLVLLIIITFVLVKTLSAAPATTNDKTKVTVAGTPQTKNTMTVTRTSSKTTLDTRGPQKGMTTNVQSTKVTTVKSNTEMKSKTSKNLPQLSQAQVEKRNQVVAPKSKSPTESKLRTKIQSTSANDQKQIASVSGTAVEKKVTTKTNSVSTNQKLARNTKDSTANMNKNIKIGTSVEKKVVPKTRTVGTVQKPIGNTKESTVNRNTNIKIQTTTKQEQTKDVKTGTKIEKNKPASRTTVVSAGNKVTSTTSKQTGTSPTGSGNIKTNKNVKTNVPSKGTVKVKSQTNKTSENLKTTAIITKQASMTSKEVVKGEKKSDENVITTSTTTEATATDGYETATTWDGLPCSSRFRAHPVDNTQFETAFSENVFEKNYQKCPATLVWRQDQCRCGWPDLEVADTENTCKCCRQGLKAHPTNSTMYMRLVNGQWLEETCSTYDNNQLWDNENCSCVWDPNKPRSHKAPVFKGAILPRLMTKCMNLVNMTLDEGLTDASGRDLTPYFGGQRIRVVDEKGNIGKSVEIRRAPFKIGIFNGNDLQSTVYFKFSFKVHPDHVRRRKKMVIMSNGCKRRWKGRPIQPSLEVSFYPYNETFEVKFSTTKKTILEHIKGSKDPNGWYQCVLYLQDRVLSLQVNGQKVYSTNGMSGRVKSTDCPLTVAGSPINPKEHFDGYLDELNFVKQCKYEQVAA